MAHAEASARTIEAAVATAAAQLGLRADQVDVEILEEPVASTFGYIGSPARVRVTSRAGSVSAGGVGSESASTAAVGMDAAPGLAAGSNSSLDATSEAALASSVGADPASSAGADPASPSGAESASSAGGDPVPSTGTTEAPGPVSSFVTTPAPGSLSGRTADSPPKVDQSAPIRHNVPSRSNSSDNPDDADSTSMPVAGSEPATNLGSGELGPSAADDAAELATSSNAQVSPAQVSPTSARGSNGDRGTERDSASAPSLRSASSPAPPPNSESPGTPRPSRRNYRDEPIDPAAVEADTERAGDFLEGLLDAMDVDGDITTWVDEAGGHIDLEGSDLDVLVGSNGETLDSLQELTRLAVLRQSKRRARLLLDINGFRARQRERLISMVKATAEQVIRTREDHEFQPMSPAERKIVHDAVATIDGAKTESLGEDPNRRVIIRPA